MKHFLIWASTCITVFLSFTCQRNIQPKDDFRYVAPPNGVKLKFNFYCDQTEISNITWHEYCYWLLERHGATSNEYLSALPDTNVWLNEHPALHHLKDTYFRNRAYDNYPVVGITQKQAEKFSEWRSLVVFQMFLISEKYMDVQSVYDLSNDFSIERYFNGTCKWVKGTTKPRFYPRFRLPTQDERLMILNYADTVNLKYFEKCNSSFCKECKNNYPKMNSNWYEKIMKFNLPLEEVRIDCVSKKGAPLYHIRGNVNEWLSTPNKAAGGGWKHKRKEILERDTFSLFYPDAATGFRNVVEWIEWNY